MTVSTIPTSLDPKVGGVLISTNQNILIISTHTKAIISIELRTTRYPYRYTGTIQVHYGGTYLCLCEWAQDSTVELRIGAVGCIKKMPYVLNNSRNCDIITIMPPNQTDRTGGIASLESLCQAALLLVPTATEEKLEVILPHSLVPQIMLAPKLHLSLMDDLGNRKVTCRSREHVWNQLNV